MVPDDEDALRVLHQTTPSGRVHRFTHFLYVPNEHAASRAVSALRDRGLEHVEVQDSVAVEQEQSRVVIVTLEVVPTSETARESRCLFEAIADTVGGEYDGWQVDAAGSYAH